jgi:hypothetical protein
VQKDILAIILKRDPVNIILKKEPLIPSKDGSNTESIPLINIGFEKHK